MSVSVGPMLARLGATVVILACEHESELTLRYDWPSHGNHARVWERVLKKGREAEMSYVLRWAQDETDETTLIEYTDFELLAMTGFDASNPAHLASRIEAEAMASAIPQLRIDGEGYLVGFEGFEDMVEHILEAASESLDMHVLERLEQTLHQPHVRETIEGRLADVWAAWVDNWVDAEIVRGESEEWAIDTDLTGGIVSEYYVTYGELSLYRGCECVEITMEGEADEDILMSRVIELRRAMRSSESKKLPTMARVTRRDVIRGIYAVQGLRPLEVHTSTVSRAWFKGTDESREEVERHDYYFDWSDVEPFVLPVK